MRPPGTLLLIDERQLILRARNGDEEAFDALVARHGRLVLRVARSIVGSLAEAEDVAQEVFLRLYRSLGRLDPARPLEPWVVRLTLNAARSHRERSPARRETGLEAAGPRTEDGGQGFRQVAATDLRRILGEALAAVTEREREVFLLRDVHGLKAAVVADALGIAEVTVRRLSTSARAKIRRRLEAEHPELIGGIPRPAARSAKH
ncbi:MAG: sigma-70 family RNA polymerase sigma factor [Acidobacteria bacterium]|nr:MAG: sigma-70 family RNA polymerase sigma factor [Acidobacteriota bacterium]